MSHTRRFVVLPALCIGTVGCANLPARPASTVSPLIAEADRGSPEVGTRPRTPTVAVAARDSEPLITDRPDFTESPSVVAPGRIQLEAGETFGREDGTDYLSLGEALFRFGLRPRLELRVAANSYGFTRDGQTIGTGFEDAGLGVKYAIIEEPHGGWPRMAVIAGVSLPTGTRTMSSQRTLPEVKLVAGWDVTDRIDLATNANWAHASRDGVSHDEWSGSVSVWYAVDARIGLYAEAFAFRERLATLVRRDYVNGGVAILLTNDLQLDMRVGRGPSPSRGDYFTGLGLSHRW